MKKKLDVPLFDKNYVWAFTIIYFFMVLVKNSYILSSKLFENVIFTLFFYAGLELFRIGKGYIFGIPMEKWYTLLSSFFAIGIALLYLIV